MRSRRNGSASSMNRLWVSGLCALALVATGSAAELDNVTVLVESGEQVPDDVGVFDNMTAPVHAGNGQVAFATDVMEGFSVVETRIYRANGAGLSLIAAEDDPSPDGNGNLGSIRTGFAFPPQALLVNEAGQVAFFNRLNNTFGGFSDDNAILVGDGNSLSIIAREGQTPPGAPGPFTTLGNPIGLNRSGRVVFRAFYSGGEGIFRGDGTPGGLSAIALLGQALPGGGMIGDLPTEESSLNRDGEVSFLADSSTPSARGIYVGNGNDPLVEIVRTGDPIPSGVGTFDSIPSSALFPPGFDRPTFPINRRGEVAFFARLAGTPGGVMDDAGLFLGDGSQLIELVRRGDPAPDGNGSFLDIALRVALDDAGRVAFYSTLTGFSNGAESGLFVADREGVRQIARQNALAPGGGIFSSFEYFSGSSANAGVVFQARVEVEENGLTRLHDGIFLYDGSTVRSIARVGDTLQGVTIEDVEAKRGQGSGLEGNVLGANGDVAFLFFESFEPRVALWSEISIFEDGFESGDLLGWSASVP